MAFWRRQKQAPEEAPTEPARAAGETPPHVPADPHERIDGLRAWLAQIDRKLGVRTYALGAAAVLALAAGIVGIVLALGIEEDSAKQEDLKDLRQQIAAVEKRADAQAEQGVQAVSDRVEQLENDLSRLSGDQTRTEDELSVVEDDIRDLRNEISQLDSGGSGGR
jgi:septal ring factor EnvC (AmiA/AmiB activator)